jgi:hypothetical protein
MLLAFKMGVKIFCTATIFSISPRRLLLLHHDTFILHRRFIFGTSRSFNFYRAALFQRLRQDSLFLPRCHRSARNNIYDFTALPSFVATRYF